MGVNAVIANILFNLKTMKKTYYSEILLNILVGGFSIIGWELGQFLYTTF